MTLRPCLIVLLALTTGCAARDSGRFPSLLPRAIETRSDAEPEAVVAAAAPDPALDAQLLGYRKTLDENDSAFVRAAALAEQRAWAAKGDAAGSDRWLDAQTALADLDGYRATASALVTDIEQAAIARAADGKPDYPGLETLRTAAQASLDRQSARIGAIQASLPEA